MTKAGIVNLFFTTLLRRRLENLCIYTDGSKNPNSKYAGFAVVNLDENISSQFKTPGFLSTFTLEALAIKKALRITENNNLKCVTIFSDSKSVLTSLKTYPSDSKTSHLMYLIKDKIRKLQNCNHNIKLIWISSHCNIIGNELADTRAKSALLYGIEWNDKIPIGDFKNLFKELLYTKFFEWCDLTGKERGKVYFQNYFIRNRKTWFQDLNLPRRAIISLRRLRCGHTSLNESLGRFNIVPSPLCSSCEVIESPNHIFWQCPRFKVQREKLINDITERRGVLPHPIESFLVDISEGIAYILSEFITNINIYI